MRAISTAYNRCKINYENAEKIIVNFKNTRLFEFIKSKNYSYLQKIEVVYAICLIKLLK
jgi:hypothetical protein